MAARKVLKWISVGIGAVVSLALLAVTVVYVIIGSDLSTTFDIPASDVALPVDDASVAEGQRLARIRGCFGDCHGDTVNGALFFDLPDGSALVSPDLAAAANSYTTAEMARVIRHGVRPDGTSVILAMPSLMFYHLSDSDIGSIIGFLQSQTPRSDPLPKTRFGPIGRLLLLLFKQETGTILAAESIRHDQARLDASAGDSAAYGRYLAMTSCSECHGPELGGSPDENIPPLAIAAAYSLEDFTTLLRTGEPVGGRQLGLMAAVSTQRFSHFTDAEIAAIHDYLRALATSP